ncbi:MAG: hypothetical protein ACI3VY_01995 [Faecousia sp.]
MRLIDADAKTFPTPYKINDTEHAKGWNSCLNSISQQPTIDAEPVRHGHWEYVNTHPFQTYYSCSECGNVTDDYIFNNQTLQYDKLYYCPNCGAKMDGGDNNGI